MIDINLIRTNRDLVKENIKKKENGTHKECLLHGTILLFYLILITVTSRKCLHFTPR